MKRKILSLITGILSLIDALALLAVTLFCIFKINSVARIIADKSDDLWGIEMITYAGMGYILAILGLIISGGLTGYRAMLGYYYIKIFASDEEFYSERRSGIIGFSALGGILFAIGLIASIEKFSFLPESVYPLIVGFTALYGLLVFLPIAELILSGIFKPKAVNVILKEAVTKDKVIEELDALADKQAERKSEGGKQEEERETKPIKQAGYSKNKKSGKGGKKKRKR